MKSYITDTLIGLFAFDETGNILNFLDFNNDDQKIIEFYVSLDKDVLLNEYEELLIELKNSGFDEFVFDNKKLESLTSQNLGYKTFLEIHSLEFKNFRFNLEDKLKTIGLTKSRNDIRAKFKKINEELIKKKVSKAGGQTDVVITQIIETLDVLKKSISLFSSRLREWYGLHFPELTDKILEDNILIARMVSVLGKRENFTKEKLLKDFEFNENFHKGLISKASNSMGADIDLNIVQGFANQILSLDSYRKDLEVYLNDLMEKLAPNLNSVIGSLVGAKLIAKAGSLKKLALMPASRVQLLGAEKALYRFLKTGEKRPKHGLIFQYNQIRSKKPWLRGKISRLISGKIGIASKVDYFEGAFIGDFLAKGIEKKIKEIEEKYPNPPKRAEPEKPKPRPRQRPRQRPKQNPRNYKNKKRYEGKQK